MARSGATASKTGVILSAPKIGATQDEEAAARPDAAAGDSGGVPPGARDLHRKLDEAFAPPPAPETVEDGAEAADAPAPRRAWSLAFRRSIKILAALALIAFFGAGPLKTLLQAASVEAVVNSRIVTIRSPIDGEIVAAPRDASAWSAVKGAPVLHIVDPKADRGRLDDMRRALGRAEDERIGTEARLEQARATLAALEKQTGQFTTGRVSQLEARLAALRSDLAAASARSEEAKASLDRLTAITRPGVVSGADLARVRRDQLVAAETEQAARHRIEEASIELAAARNGSFLGDSYNDRPSSAQRADEVRQRIGDLTADLASRAAEIGRLRGELAAEESRFRNLSDVEIAMPVSGRVWEVMASPGEQVRRGQDLIRVLDCSTAVVTANVAEAVYNRLKIGSPATFHPSDSGESFDGVVVNLTGMSGAPANFAIQPHALLKEAYHVTVSVPRLAENGGCAVGRTGRVVFGAQPDGVQAEAAPFGLRR